MADLEDRIIELESTVALQQNMLDKLTSTVTDQQIQIKELEKDLKILVNHLKQVDSQFPEPESGETPFQKY